MHLASLLVLEMNLQVKVELKKRKLTASSSQCFKEINQGKPIDTKSLRNFCQFTSGEVKNLMRRLDLNGNRKVTLNELSEALTVSNRDLFEETKE